MILKASDFPLQCITYICTNEPFMTYMYIKESQNVVKGPQYVAKHYIFSLGLGLLIFRV